MKFSVLISVYKSETPEYFSECLESIKNQSLPAEEIIIIEDGPLPLSLQQVIAEYKKQLPIISLKLKKNVGLAQALNEGLKIVTNEIIIRMDSDDICVKERFESIIDIFSKNPKISVMSSWIEERDETMSHVFGIKKLPEKNHSLIEFAKYRSPIAHPASAFKKEAVLSVGGYPSIYPEDYALWIKMIHAGYIFYNIQKVLLIMRCGNNMLKRRGAKFLKGEYQTHLLQYKLGLTNPIELLKAITTKTILRLSPIFLKRIFYKNFR